MILWWTKVGAIPIAILGAITGASLYFKQFIIRTCLEILNVITSLFYAEWFY